MMELGATVCTARRAALRRVPGRRVVRERGRPAAAPRPRAPPRPRFEDTDRYARGRDRRRAAGGRPLPALGAGARSSARSPASRATA